MSDEPKPLSGGTFRSPSAMKRVREKREELNRQLDAGEIAPDDAKARLDAYTANIFAHIREHGADAT